MSNSLDRLRFGLALMVVAFALPIGAGIAHASRISLDPVALEAIGVASAISLLAGIFLMVSRLARSPR